MLKSERQNFHHSMLPKLGELGFIAGLPTIDSQRKCIVIAFPLMDSPDYRYSLGIHTCWIRFLDNGEHLRLSGIWFQAQG